MTGHINFFGKHRFCPFCGTELFPIYDEKGNFLEYLPCECMEDESALEHFDLEKNDES